MGWIAAVLLALCLLGGLRGLDRAQAAEAAQASAPAFPTDRPLRFERFSLADGLSQNSVLSLLQDRKGYLWIGTQDGLNRYDGYNFTVYKRDPDNPDSLSNNGVISLLEDRDGILWVGTWGGGLDRLDPVSGHILRYQNDPQQPDSLGADIVAALAADPSGRIWVGTIGGGLNLFDPKTGKFTRYRHNPQDSASLSSDAVSSLLLDPDGRLWVGTGGFSSPGGGLDRFDPATGKATHYRSDPQDLRTLSSDNISALQRTSDGSIWVATGGYALSGGGLNRLDPQTGQVSRYQNDPLIPSSLASNDLINLYLDPQGMLWIATYGEGLDRLDPAHPEMGFLHTRNNPFNPDSLSGNQIWSLLQDRSGVMWVGTVNDGLDKLNPQVQRFRLFRKDPNDVKSVSFDSIGPMLEDRQGRIWVGTYGGGLNLYQPALGTFSAYSEGKGPADSIMAIYEDSQGTLWTGSLAGLSIFDPATGRFTRFTHEAQNPASLADNNVSGVLEDGAGRLWVAMLGGLDVFDRATRTFMHVKIEGLGSVVSMYVDRHKMLWLGTWGSGIYRLDPASLSQDGQVKILAHYQVDPKNPAGISDNSVWSFLEDADGTLWLATSGGLDRLDPATGSFRVYHEKNGLANDTTLCIEQDAQGLLWISTNDGISRFDPKTETFRTFDASDGLQSNEFDSWSCLKTRSDELYFGGVHGLSAFNPAEILDNPTPPPVAITAFRIFNDPFPIDQSGGTAIHLSYRQDFISFEFAALDFHAPSKNQYAYQLEGFDKDWIQAGNRRYVSYTNLSGGSYTFRVKATNNDGIWNAVGVAVPIQVSPPFWATWWFIGGLIILGACAVAAGVVWRIESVRVQNRHLEQLVSERTTTLRETNVQLESEVEQRKRAEEALSKKAAEDLRQSEARFRAMFENAAVGIGLMTLDRRVLEVNDAVTAIFGYSAKEFSQMVINDIIHPDDREIDREQFLELAAGQRHSYQTEKRYLHKDGHYVWAKLILSAVASPSNKPVYLLGMMVDIDEQKRIEQELDQQEEAYLRQLEMRVYERTHELRQMNEQLQAEMEQRLRAEEALAKAAAEEAVVSERNRLARDLHDAVTQTLFSASLLAEVLPELIRINPEEGSKRLQELRQLTRGALAEMRTLLVELRPSALTDIPLADLLRQLAEATVGRARLQVEFSVDGEGSLPPDVQLAFYRIVQEALNNVVKYARASQAGIALRFTPGGARVTVVDNGVGFDPEKVPSGHFGLGIMRERAEAVGARVSVYSEPGQGAQITVVWNKPSI